MKLAILALAVATLILLSGCVTQDTGLSLKEIELEGCEERVALWEESYLDSHESFLELADTCQESRKEITDTGNTTIQGCKELLSFYQSGWEEGIKTSTITHFIPSFCGYRLIRRINSATYFAFKKKEHPALDENISAYITSELPQIEQQLETITKACKPDTSREKAQWILAYVHRIRYEPDLDNYTKYPIETLAEGAGDCEDLSILAATLMKAAGLDVVLILFEGHMGVGVNVKTSGDYFNYDGKKYYYAETTGTEWIDEPTGWQIGQLPDDYKNKEATIIPI